MISDERGHARGRIALAGAAGSHPEMIRLVTAALDGAGADTPLVIDMSAFDRRGSADYALRKAEVVRPDPQEAGLSSRFATAAPNMVLSGGVRAFARLQAMFGDLMDEAAIGVLMMCHSWGFPEQALIRAARDRGIIVFQIDEGPFSLPLRGTVPESSRRTARVGLRALRGLRLLPPRDMTGRLIDRVLVTAKGRQEQLIERGVDPDKLIIVPPPRFDRLADLAQAWPGRTFDQNARRILWLHQPFRADGKVRADEVDRAEQALASALARVGARLPIRVIPRLHPRSDENERARLFALLEGRGLTIQAEAPRGLYESMLGADAAVGFYSSALLEAAVCTMPVVAARLDPAAFDQKTEAAKAGAMGALGIPVAREAGELAAILEAGLVKATRPVPPRLLEQEIGWLNGKGAATVAALLIDALPDRADA
ncbi:MAG: hypothetical protein CL820_10025 [Croceicoccus sp.]|nr:hypothetical protein [Croceicoccus sp.]